MPQLISNLSELTSEAVAAFRKAIAQPQPADKLAKSITQATGLTAYDLQAPAKQLFPVLTPIRNKIPRVSGRGGTATNWKAVTAINTASLRGFVPEGTRNGRVATSVVERNASYKTYGLEDSVTFEAERAGQGFEDIKATTAQRLLWATMIEEELQDLGGNAGLALGTPTAPTVTAVNGGGTIADGTYNVIVVALSLFGFLASSLPTGIVGAVSVSTATGNAFSYGGGSSNKSSATSTGELANGGDLILRASTPVVRGAVAYAWFVGAAGSELLQAITTINSVELKSLVTTGRQNASAITADNSRHTYGYDGILYQAWADGSNAYIHSLATGTAGAGTPLSTDNAGGIVEIDAMLEAMWSGYKLSPTTIYVNAQEAKNITKLLLGGSGVNYNLNMAPGSEFTAGAIVARYLNKFSMGGGQVIPIQIHPYLPAGTLTALTEQLPYPVTNIPNVMEKILRQDYYQIEWPLRERAYETGVYADGVLAHYFPPSIGIISNIGG
jgi:hypothetical protein